MAYSVEERETILSTIFDTIETGKSLRYALSQIPLSSKSFYEWIDEDEEKVKQYARATELRAENMFEDILSIVDENTNDVITLEDGREIVNNDVIQRARLRMDARKWMLGKLNPKKYGDKLDMTTGGDKIQTSAPNIKVTIVKALEEDE